MDDLLKLLKDQFGNRAFTAEEAVLVPIPFEDYFPSVGHAMARVARGEPGASVVRSVANHLRRMDGLSRVGRTRNDSGLWRVD